MMSVNNQCIKLAYRISHEIMHTKCSQGVMDKKCETASDKLTSDMTTITMNGYLKFRLKKHSSKNKC